MTPAGRIEGLGLSPIRAMHAGAAPGTIPLGLGEPTWELPTQARRALSAQTGPCSYGPNAGLPELREAIASYAGVRDEELMVGSGSQGVLFAICQAFLDPGDEVLLPDPGFLAYPILTRLAGAQARPYALGEDFRLDAGAFKSALATCVVPKLAIVNHPANPTGAGAGAEALVDVAKACEERGVILVSDEVYRELYLGEPPTCLRDLGARGISLGSVSKAWGGPGLRIGWAIGDPELLERVRLVHNYMVTSPARPSQAAATALLEASDLVLPAARSELAARWEALREGLASELGIEAAVPAGAFYYWLPLPTWGRADPLAFCLRLRDEGGVIVVPGLAFGSGGRDSVRLSYSARPEVVREGIRRLASFWRRA